MSTLGNLKSNGTSLRMKATQNGFHMSFLTMIAQVTRVRNIATEVGTVRTLLMLLFVNPTVRSGMVHKLANLHT